MKPKSPANKPGAGANQESELDILFSKAAEFSFCDRKRMQSLVKLAERVTASGIPGDFVECGSYKGGTAAILSRYMPPERKLWVYDGFAGMPPTSPKDSADAHKYVGEGACSPDDVREIMRRVGTPEDRFTIKPGWFNETFQQPLPAQVAFLHCDCDWYESVLLVLDTFYHLVPVGGCIVLDDFGYWAGCREAFYDFCNRTGEKPLLERVGGTQAYWIKGTTENR